MLNFITVVSSLAAFYLILTTITGKNYLTLLINWIVDQTESREVSHYRRRRIFKPSNSKWAKYRRFIKKRTEEIAEDRLFGINFIIPFTGYNTILFIISGIGYFLGHIFLGPIFGIFSFFIIAVGINIILSIRGKDRNDKYLFDLLNEINYLCSDMRGGLSSAIDSQKNNLDRFKEKFLKFNNRITLGGMSFEESLRLLEADLGPASHEFLRAALNYEQRGTESTLRVFEDIVRHNGSIEEINALQRRDFSRHTEEINHLLVATGVILVFILIGQDTMAVLKQWYGQIILGSILLSVEVLIAMVEILREPLYIGREENGSEGV